MANLFITGSQDCALEISNSNWDTAHDATSATTVNSYSSASPGAGTTSTEATVRNYYYAWTHYITRLHYLFDVSSITTTPATCIFGLWVDSSYSNTVANATPLYAVKGTGGVIGTDFVGADFNNLEGWTSGFGADDLTLYADDEFDGTGWGHHGRNGNNGSDNGHVQANLWKNDGEDYMQFTLNSAALADIANSNTFHLVLMDSNDYNDTAVTNPWLHSYFYPVTSADRYGQAWSTPYREQGRKPLLVYTAGSTGKPFIEFSTYDNYVDLIDMTGSAAPTNKGALHAMSGSIKTLSGLIISGSATYAVDIATNSGSIIADEYVTYSDWELKTNIKPLTDSLSKIKKLESVVYEKKASGKKEVGFIAQDVAKIIPEVCALDDEGKGIGVDYSRISALVADGIKEQQQQIETQERKLKALKDKLQKIKEKIKKE